MPPMEAPSVCSKCRGAGYLRTNLPYGHPGFGKPVACECKEAELKEKQQRQLAKRSDILGLRYFRDASFATFEASVPGVREARQASMRFAADPSGWLVLAGPRGCGKTHLVVSIAKQCVELGYTVLIQTVPDLLLDLRSIDADARQVLKEIQQVDVLILDDYGVRQSDTDWVKAMLFQIFNYRYNDMLPTVVTTNLMDVEALSMVEPRIASRMTDTSLSAFIRMSHAQDYRPQKAPVEESQED